MRFDPISIGNQIVNVAKMTDLKNKMIKSPKVAAIDFKKDTGSSNNAQNKTGIVAFSLPEESRQSKDLQSCEEGSADEKNNTILLVGI